MTPARWREVTRVYAAVAARDPSARAEALALACGADEELRREVEALLAEDGSIVIDRPAAAVTGVLPSQLPVQIGSQIGVYRVDALLGVGGMGEVYRARDTKLNRDVAIKLLPAAFAGDPERLARFRREAQVLASLNHSNIATIHGFEDASGTPALVMELIEGPTLAELIDGDSAAQSRMMPQATAPSRGRGATARGGGAPRGLRIEDALAVARQIADALEAAHEQGIVHRDLKPTNIKVREDGTVKVLDFGLARFAEGPGGSGGPGGDFLTQSPTITTPAMTAAGIILGTAAYMSPEQAKGKPADKRSDVWAFGCVLYEMLSGKRPFEGEDVTDTLAAILRAEPDWTAVPPESPELIVALLKHCLEKDHRRRVADIAAARFVLAEAVISKGASPRNHAVEASASQPLGLTVVAMVLLTAIVAGGAAWMLKPARATPAPGVVRFGYLLKEGDTFSGTTGSSCGERSPDRGVFVQPFPTTGDVYQAPKVRIDYHPAWTPKGDGILYVASTAVPMIKVPVKTQPSLAFGAPEQLQHTIPQLLSTEMRGHDPLPDDRLLMVAPVQVASDSTARPEIRVVVNWVEELKQKVPVTGR